jgi:DNA segregation ATPase FtsK/SpoIIIE-like protein
VGAVQVDLVERLGTLDMPRDPSRPTIHPAARQTRLARLIRALRRAYAHREQIVMTLLGYPILMIHKLYHARPWRELTGEEKALRAEQERRRKLAATLRDEAMLYWDRLVSALDRYGFQHTTSSGSKITTHVQFDLIKLQPEAIYFRINTLKLPYGTTISKLMDRDLLIDLSLACQRRVTAEFSDRIGAWYIVERAVGVRGIPDHVKFNELLDSIPASADGLTIPIGVALNSKPIWRSLGRMYSMLIGGTIGGGKSNYLNVVITTLIRRNPPDRLRLVLIDLKGGLEFQYYEGIPHLISIPEYAPGGIADQNYQVQGVLEWLHAEGERRMETLRQAGYKSIGRYNAYKKHKRMPHIVLVIDEWADVMYDKSIKQRCEDVLANVAQRFRAVGIHVIVCTQIPKAEVISTRIKGVLPAKLAFSVPTIPASMVILDNGDAKGLTPSGRAVFQWDGQYEVQTPYINEDIVEAAVQQAITGTVDKSTKSHDVTQFEILEWALAEENGYLSFDVLFRHFGKRGLTFDELRRWLAEMEGQQIVIGTSLYRVAPSAGNRPRRLIAVDENADDIPDEPEQTPNSRQK